jgi:hypothetical protein
MLTLSLPPDYIPLDGQAQDIRFARLSARLLVERRQGWY